MLLHVLNCKKFQNLGELANYNNFCSYFVYVGGEITKALYMCITSTRKQSVSIF